VPTVAADLKLLVIRQDAVCSECDALWRRADEGYILTVCFCKVRSVFPRRIPKPATKKLRHVIEDCHCKVASLGLPETCVTSDVRYYCYLTGAVCANICTEGVSIVYIQCIMSSFADFFLMRALVCLFKESKSIPVFISCLLLFSHHTLRTFNPHPISPFSISQPFYFSVLLLPFTTSSLSFTLKASS